MTSTEFKNFIERIKICLRRKRDDDPVHDAKCSMDEIFNTFSADEQILL